MNRLLAMATLAAVLSLPSLSHAARERHLQYEPAVVTLEGVIIERRFYGPPGYGEDRKHDSRETELLIDLDEPISVAENNLYDSQSNQWRIQITGFLLPKLVPLIGRHVRLIGTLFGATTGHHKTPVLIWVNEVRAPERRHF